MGLLADETHLALTPLGEVILWGQQGRTWNSVTDPLHDVVWRGVRRRLSRSSVPDPPPRGRLQGYARLQQQKAPISALAGWGLGEGWVPSRQVEQIPDPLLYIGKKKRPAFTEKDHLGA